MCNIHQNYKVKIHHIDVGQGDATLVIVKKREVEKDRTFTILIDGGRSGKEGNANKEYIKKKLAGRKLNVIVNSHQDSDHVNGLKNLNEFLDVQKTLLYHQPLKYYKQTAKNTILDIGKKCDRMILADPYGDELIQKEIEIKDETGNRIKGITMACVAGNENIVGYEKESGVDEKKGPTAQNQASLVYLLKYGDLSYLTGGDIGRRQEEMIVKCIGLVGETGYNLKINLLGFDGSKLDECLHRVKNKVTMYKVSHHGSEHSGIGETGLGKSGGKFIIPAENYVISCGISGHKHPREAVVKTLLDEKDKPRVYVTGQRDFMKSDGTTDKCCLENPEETPKFGVVSLTMYNDKNVDGYYIAEDRVYEKELGGVFYKKAPVSSHNIWVSLQTVETHRSKETREFARGLAKKIMEEKESERNEIIDKEMETGGEKSKIIKMVDNSDEKGSAFGKKRYKESIVYKIYSGRKQTEVDVKYMFKGRIRGATSPKINYNISKKINIEKSGNKRKRCRQSEIDNYVKRKKVKINKNQKNLIIEVEKNATKGIEKRMSGGENERAGSKNGMLKVKK